MTLISSKKTVPFRWTKGDLITASEACGILGYKTGRNLQDKDRRETLRREFEILRLPLTFGIFIGAQQRFIRREFENFIEAKIEAAVGVNNKRAALKLVA